MPWMTRGDPRFAGGDQITMTRRLFARIALSETSEGFEIDWVGVTGALGTDGSDVLAMFVAMTVNV